MGEVTRILSEIEQGRAQAADQLLPLVYDELRKLAAAKLSREQPGQTLQATALVHEAYLRLLGQNDGSKFEGRNHFFAAAAEAMRRLLVERARRHLAQKRGGDWERIELFEDHHFTVGTPDRIVALHEALAHLEAAEPEGTALLKLVVFGGQSIESAGELLDMSRATAYRHWAYVRAWIKNLMDDDQD